MQSTTETAVFGVNSKADQARAMQRGEILVREPSVHINLGGSRRDLFIDQLAQAGKDLALLVITQEVHTLFLNSSRPMTRNAAI